MSFTAENVKNFKVEDQTLKRHKSIRVFVYIDTGSPMLNIPLKSRDLADENNFFLTEWKWFDTTVLIDYMTTGYKFRKTLK
jgi:hypothetical protein